MYTSQVYFGLKMPITKYIKLFYKDRFRNTCKKWPRKSVTSGNSHTVHAAVFLWRWICPWGFADLSSLPQCSFLCACHLQVPCLQQENSNADGKAVQKRSKCSRTFYILLSISSSPSVSLSTHTHTCTVSAAFNTSGTNLGINT